MNEEDVADSLTEAKVREMKTAVGTARVIVFLSTAKDNVEILENIPPAEMTLNRCK